MTPFLESSDCIQDIGQRDMVVHVYQLNDDESAQEMNGGDDSAAYQHWVLPNQEFAGLWDS